MSQEQYYYLPDNGESWVGSFNPQQLNELRASGVVQPSFLVYSGAEAAGQGDQSAQNPPSPPQNYPQPQGYPPTQNYQQPQVAPPIQGYVQTPSAYPQAQQVYQQPQFQQQAPQGTYSQIVINNWGSAPQWQSGPVLETEAGKEIVKMLMDDKRCASQVIEELVQRGTDVRMANDMVYRVISELESKAGNNIVYAVIVVIIAFAVAITVNDSSAAKGLILVPGWFLMNSIGRYSKIKKLKK